MLGKFALKQFQALNNGISDTQRAALETGTVGYEASVFAGKPDWKGLLSLPAPELSPEEKSFLDNEVEELCRRIDDWKIRDELQDMPDDVWQFLKEKKFFGMIIPKEYGGLGFSAQAHSAVVTKIGTRSGTVAANTMVPNSLGPAELLSRYGTPEQKDHYLPRLADGREVPCFSLTSPQAGSDATNQKDDGVVFKNKVDGKLYIKLNWDKRYITLAPVATLFGIAFNLKDPEHLLGDKEAVGITLALIPAETPGIQKGLRHHPIGAPFQCGPHQGKDVVVPLDSIIGGPPYAGQGWSMLINCLSVGRSVSLPASSAASARLAARVTGAYSFVRNQFGMPLAKMEGVQEALARIGGLTYMIDAARTLPLQDLDLAHKAGKEARPAVSSAILKYHTTESARKISLDAMDIFAGKGVCDGPNNPVGMIYQGVPVGITVEGANILTRSMMVFGQAAFLAHPYTLKELKAARDNDAKAAGKLLRQHLCNIFNNVARSFVMGITNGWKSRAPQKGPDQKFYGRINRLSSAYACAANITMLALQGSLAKKERTSALLGDVFSNLYMASQVLRRYNYEGRKKEDTPLMQWAATQCLYQAEQAMYELIDNHPSKLARAFLKPIVFPFGRRMKKPSHELDRKVAEALSTPGGARDRLTAGMFIPKDSADFIARLEKAFDLAHKAFPHEQALLKAVRKGSLSQSQDHMKMIEEALDKKLIDGDTAKLLKETQEARNSVIAVDSFPANQNRKQAVPASAGAPKP
ncbi:MAG: acyl-CoA dehydrogenase [Alphaproteobacteria bacterium]|nr:MAG: acyl-CoA dehydrogenase [Alphaproteobacteria bacterium]